MEVKYAGRLSYFFEQWESITSDKVILSWIKGYEIPFICPPVRSDSPHTISRSKEEFLRSY